MPAPYDYEIVFGINPDRVGPVADRRKAARRRRRPLLFLRVEPPEKPIIRSETRWCRGRFDPLLRNDLPAAPLTFRKKQVTEPRFISRADPQSAAPSCPAAHRLHLLTVDRHIRLGVTVVVPRRRSTDRVHHVFFQHLRQRPLPNLEQ